MTIQDDVQPLIFEKLSGQSSLKIKQSRSENKRIARKLAAQLLLFKVTKVS